MLLTTERLVLRAVDEADADFLLALLNSPGFLRYIGDRGVRDRAGAEAYIRERMLSHYAAHGFGMYRVARRADGEPLGLAGLVRREGLPGVDLGYALLPEHGGQGYAREAAAAVVAHAFGALGLPELLAICDPDNAGSIRLLESLGFVHASALCLPGETTRLNLYRLAAGSGRRGPGL